MKSKFSLLLLLFSLALEVSGQHYFFRQYTYTEGLLHSFVYDINQDHKGFLWIGTPDGIYRFNGFDFEHFTIEDGLADNFATEIFIDSKGKIWIGHQNGTVSLQVKTGFTAIHNPLENKGSVTDLAEDEMGSVWFSTQNHGLSIIDKDLKIKTVDFPDLEESITQIECIDTNQFIIGTQESLYLAIYQKDISSMKMVSKIESYAGSRVVGIFRETNGGYVIASQNGGVYYFRSDSTSGKYQLSLIDDNSDGLLDNLQGGLMDGKGELWFYSMGNGLIRFSSLEDQNYTRLGGISEKNGLVSENIRSMFEDIEGNLWIGTFGEGLLRYVDNNLRFYRFGEEDEPTENYAITNYNDDFLVVTGNRLLKTNQFGDSILRSYPLPATQLGDRINAIFADDGGRIWLGYERSGLFVSDSNNTKLSPVFISGDELSNSINHITGKGEYIWISTKRGICRISRDSKKSLWFTTNDGLPHNHIKQLFINADGRIYIATLCNKIYYIHHNSEVAILENSATRHLNSIVSFAEDQLGNLWTGTHGNGVWMINKDTVINYSRLSGLLSDYCYSLALTKEGEPIIGHTGGISLIETKTNHIKTFSRLEGVKSSVEFFPNATITDRMGNVWFGTSEGLVRYTSSISKGGEIPPMLQINAVLIDGDTIDHTRGPILLKPGEYEIAVDFIGLNFSHPEMVFYQTQLENYTENWSEPSFSRRAIFGRVGFGEYSFNLRAYNENDVLSEMAAAFEIKIKKPVYQTIWFYLLFAIAIGSSFYLLLRIRERNHKMVQERLLKNLDEKTKEIIIKEEIIKERKKVEKVLIEAKIRAELSEKLKTSFLQNMSHEIRTPMNAIVGFTQLLGEEGLSAENRKEYIANVSLNAESLLKLINDIMDLSKLETNQLEIKEEVCNIREIILELESIFRKSLIKDGKEAIQFETVTPGEDDLKIRADRSRLKQILNNLLDNALKFTEAGKITLGYSVDNNNILFFVEDTGIGLSEDKREVVFDLFRKVEDDRFKLYGGTGLGLTLAKYLVNKMGGEIDVDSKKDLGSKFYFNIPLN